MMTKLIGEDVGEVPSYRIARQAERVEQLIVQAWFEKTMSF